MADEVTETTRRGSDTVSQSSEWQDQDSVWRSSCSSVCTRLTQLLPSYEQVTSNSLRSPKQWVLLDYQVSPKVAGKMEGRGTQGPGLGTGSLLAPHQLLSWHLSSLDRAWLLLITATGNNYRGFSAVPGRLIKRDPDPKVSQSVVCDSNHAGPDTTPQGLRMTPQKEDGL